MNGARAKKLRRMIYGEMSTRQPRKYVGNEGKDGLLSFRNMGLRKLYQKAKKGGEK